MTDNKLAHAPKLGFGPVPPLLPACRMAGSRRAQDPSKYTLAEKPEEIACGTNACQAARGSDVYWRESASTLEVEAKRAEDGQQQHDRIYREKDSHLEPLGVVVQLSARSTTGEKPRARVLWQRDGADFDRYELQGLEDALHEARKVLDSRDRWAEREPIYTRVKEERGDAE